MLGGVLMGRTGVGERLPRLMIASAIVWHALLLMSSRRCKRLTGGHRHAARRRRRSKALTMVSLTVILVRESGQRFRGRVMGVRMMAIYSLPIGLLIAGALIERVGFAATATLYAALGLACAVIIALRWRRAHVAGGAAGANRA